MQKQIRWGTPDKIALGVWFKYDAFQKIYFTMFPSSQSLQALQNKRNISCKITPEYSYSIIAFLYAYITLPKITETDMEKVSVRCLKTQLWQA